MSCYLDALYSSMCLAIPVKSLKRPVDTKVCYFLVELIIDIDLNGDGP